MWNLDKLESRLVHRCLEFLVAIPVAIGLLDHDAALEQQALQDTGNVEFRVFRVAHAQCDVLEIAKKRHVVEFGVGRHA